MRTITRSRSTPSLHTATLGAAPLVLILLFRAVIHLLLYRAGFVALTADEWGRTVQAALWAADPRPLWSGFWLPLHTYAVGLSVRLGLSWVDAPRLLSIVCGLAAIGLTYQLTKELFHSRRVAMIAAALLAANPVHLWLSAVPLTEAPTIALLLACALASVRYFRQPRPAPLWAAAATLLAASAIRYEAWITAAVWSAAVAGHTLAQARRGQLRVGQVAGALGAALLPWTFPLSWLLGNAAENGDALYFARFTAAYEAQWYGQISDYGRYLVTLVRIDPLTTTLAIPSLLLCLWRLRHDTGSRWYVAQAGLPLLAFAIVQKGYPAPEGQMLRRMILFLFAAYPAVAYALDQAARRFLARPALQHAGLALVVGVAALLQVRAAFAFTNDPAASGLAVGQRIAALRATDPNAAERPAMVELAYWENLAVQVGAQDIDGILFDRVDDYTNRQAPSLLQSDQAGLRGCLAAHNVAWLAVKTPELRQIVERDFGGTPTDEVNGYAFYPISAPMLAGPQAACPLDRK